MRLLIIPVALCMMLAIVVAVLLLAPFVMVVMFITNRNGALGQRS